VQGIDVMPTLARVLGATPPAALPGHDLLAAPVERPAFVETASGIAPDGSPVEVVAVRTARWKLIETPTLARSELYDLGADPREHTDRFGSADVAGALTAELERWRATTATAAATPATDPAFAAKLRALGYAR
jgi:arylsulfatase A-like enzyme